jgi:hypothetical protein
MRLLPTLFAIVLVGSSAACTSKKYKGKDVCELLTNRDIADVMGEPFKKGYRTGMIDDDEEYIGSDCDFESEARAPNAPKQPKFRVNVEVTFLEPDKASLAVTRQEWQTDFYHDKPFYTNIHDVPGIGDGAIAATDYNRSFQLWSLIKPSTKLRVEVFNVVESEAEDRGVRIARNMYSLLLAEPKPAE